MGCGDGARYIGIGLGPRGHGELSPWLFPDYKGAAVELERGGIGIIGISGLVGINMIVYATYLSLSLSIHH